MPPEDSRPPAFDERDDDAPEEPTIFSDPAPDTGVRLIDRPDDGQRRARPPGPELKPLPDRRTVLVVDDEPLMLEVLTRILQRENYELIVADSGQQALRKAVEHGRPIDLLITDYHMPTMSGRELADEMRAQRPGMPVLYQTGFTTKLFDNRPELEEGAAFLEKPFTARGLREAVRFLLFGCMNPSPSATA